MIQPEVATIFKTVNLHGPLCDKCLSALSGLHKNQIAEIRRRLAYPQIEAWCSYGKHKRTCTCPLSCLEPTQSIGALPVQ